MLTISQSTYLRGDCQITERTVQDEPTKENYIALTVKGGAFTIDPSKILAKPFATTTNLDEAIQNFNVIDELHFVPYYFRANRGGRGQMRVGLKRH
jgi:hypothetical protein